ncbi:MAG: thioredoxin [Clostridia bacterium]|nr:thioredoxin [Clostridia bacterium]MBR0407884.1 thioredoxin [Clostridia bacterium]
MEKKKENPKKQTVLRVAFLIAALVFIALGALNGSLMDVLAKAINLCSECIGLG